MHYLATVHTPFAEWHCVPEVRLFKTLQEAEKYKAEQESKKKKDSCNWFVSITPLQAE